MLHRGDICIWRYCPPPEVVVVCGAVDDYLGGLDGTGCYRVMREKYKTIVVIHEKFLQPLGRNVFDLYRAYTPGPHEPRTERPDDDLLTPAQAAPLLGITDSTVRERCAKGAIPAVQQGGRWMIPRSMLEVPETALAEKLEEAPDA